MRRFGKVIRKWRVASEHSTKDIAGEMGVTAQQLVHLESGATPPGSETFAKALLWLLSEDTNGTGPDQRGVEGSGDTPTDEAVHRKSKKGE